MSEVQAFGRLKSLYEAMPAKNVSWIAGGALRSFLVGDKVKDLDIFSHDPQKVMDAFNGADGFKKGQENDFIANFYKDGFCYQVIKKFTYGSERETIESFDFTIVCAAIGPNGIVTHERFFIDNAQKGLWLILCQSRFRL